MAIARKFRTSAKFTGNGILVVDSGDGELDIAASAITASELATGAVTTVKLESGAASPGNSKYYGTDSGGTKGFFDLPAGGGGTSITHATLTAGSPALTAKVAYWGDTAPTLAEAAGPVYTLTVPTGTVLKSVALIGNNDNINGTVFTISIVDTDGRDLHFTETLVNAAGAFQPIEGVGINPTQDATTPGTVTSVWSNMSYASGFRAILNIV